MLPGNIDIQTLSPCPPPAENILTRGFILQTGEDKSELKKFSEAEYEEDNPMYTCVNNSGGAGTTSTAEAPAQLGGTTKESGGDDPLYSSVSNKETGTASSAQPPAQLRKRTGKSGDKDDKKEEKEEENEQDGGEDSNHLYSSVNRTRETRELLAIDELSGYSELVSTKFVLTTGSHDLCYKT